MEPRKDHDHALLELVDVLLRDGAVLRADIVVTVADIPLLGISLQAAVAGMATMTEYGIFNQWDREVRARNPKPNDEDSNPVRRIPDGDSRRR